MRKVRITSVPEYGPGGKARQPIYGTKQQAQAYQDSLILHNYSDMQLREVGKNTTYKKYSWHEEENNRDKELAKIDKEIQEVKTTNILKGKEKENYLKHLESRKIPNKFEKKLWDIGDSAVRDNKNFVWYNNGNSPDLGHRNIKPEYSYTEANSSGPWNAYYKKPIQPIIAGEQIYPIPYTGTQQLPVQSNYQPKAIDNPYITESTDWYSPEVQGGNYIPAGFRTTQKMRPLYKEGGKIDGSVPERHNPFPPEERTAYLRRKYESLLTRYPGWTNEDEQAIDDRVGIIYKGIFPTTSTPTPIDLRTLSPVRPDYYSNYDYLNKPQFENLGMEPGTAQTEEQIYKDGGKIDYTKGAQKAATKTTTQMPTYIPQPSIGEQWLAEHPQQYIGPAQGYGTPQQQRDHEYMRNKMYQQEAEERANREFAQKMKPGSDLAEKFIDAEMVMSGAGLASKVGRKALKNAYKINPFAVKENPLQYLYRTQNIGQVPGYGHEARIADKIAKGETPSWLENAIMDKIKTGDKEFIAREKGYGRWFDSDPKRMDYYLNDREGEPTEILRTVLPKPYASQYNVGNFPDIDHISRSTSTEYVLPEYIVKKAEKYSPTEWNRLIEEHDKFNTPHWLKGYPKYRESNILPHDPYSSVELQSNGLQGYSGNFPINTVKNTPGKTGAPTITEVPALTKEQEILQSFGVNPRENIKETTMGNLFKNAVGYDELNPANLEAIPARDWMKNWYNNSDTKAKIAQRSWDKNGKSIRQFRSKYPEELSPDGNYIDLLKERGISDYMKRAFNTAGVSYGDKVYINRAASFPFNRKGRNATLVHELTHDMEANGLSLSNAEKDELLEPFGLTNNDLQDKIFNSGPRESKDLYYTDPTEIHARMNEGRYTLGLNPGEPFLPSHYDKLVDKSDFFGMAPYIKDKSKFISLMNKFYTPAGIAVGAATINKKEYGGSIQDMKKVKILSTPQYDNGGEFQYYGQGKNPAQQQQWNQYINTLNSAPGQYVRNWDHNQTFQRDMARRMGITDVSGYQQDIANRAQYNPSTVNYINGLSRPDSWVGTKTIGETYRQPRGNSSISPLPVAGNTFPTTGGYNPTERPVPSMRKPQKDSWYLDGPPDYSLNSMRSYVPSAHKQDQWGCANDLNNSYEYGGNIPGTYNQLDTSWNYGRALSYMYAKDPYKLKDVIPEADENSDPENLIRIEKDEVVLQPNNGRVQAQKASTGSHASGNDKTVEVENGSFIVSDTPELKIRDKALHKEYGLKPKGTGYTPAKMISKDVNRLNTANKLLADPKTDPDSRRTAQLTVDNLMKDRIQPIVSMQENMKKAKGIPSPGEQYKTGGRKDTVYTQQFDPSGKMTLVPEVYETHDYDPNVAYSQVFDEKGRMSFVPDTPGSTGYYNPMLQRAIAMKNMQKKPVGKGIKGTVAPTGRTTMDIPGQSAIGWASGYNTLPVEDENVIPTSVPVSQPTNLQAGKQESGAGDSLGTMEGARQSGPGYTRPDKLNMLNSMLNYGTLQKFLPWEPPVTGVIPQTVYLDDTRARAAISEEANQAYRQAAMNRSGKLANFLAIQGQAGKQAADTVAQYANMNNQIANQANQQAAGITNQILEAQRNRLKSLHQGNTIAAQEYANEERKARGEVVNAYNQAWKNRAGYQNINELSEHYYMDPNTGYVKFKSDGDRVDYIKKLANSTEGGFKSPKEVYDYLISNDLSKEDASKGALEYFKDMSGSKDSKRTVSKSGNTKTTSTIYGKKFGGLHKFFR